MNETALAVLARIASRKTDIHPRGFLVKLPYWSGIIPGKGKFRLTQLEI